MTRTALLAALVAFFTAPAQAATDKAPREKSEDPVSTLGPEAGDLMRRAGLQKKAVDDLAGEFLNEGVPTEELQGAPDEARRLMKEGKALRTRLDRASQRLKLHTLDQGQEALDRLVRDRQTAREELTACLRELVPLTPKLRAIYKRMEVSTWAMLLSGKKNMARADQMHLARDFAKEVKDVSEEFDDFLVAEEEAFKLEMTRLAAEREERSRLVRHPLRLGLALLVAGLAALGSLYWRASRRLTEMTQRLATRPLVSAATGDALIPKGYRLERELGRGAMGVVYEAFDLALQRKVAVKRMREELRRSPKDLELFLAEARLVASLRHPNIVEIHSILEEDGEVFLVFEYLEGRALNENLESVSRLSLPEASRVTRQIALALDYAHARRVIHRDLKPANVMVGQAGQIKVTDFGIAHQAQKTVARLTRAESWGTPPYMAPEQEVGTVSAASDLYSLAVCLYEMLTGSLPFDGPNYLAQKRELRFEPPSRRADGLPPGLDDLMRRALAAEPGQRFRSGSELVAALESIV